MCFWQGGIYNLPTHLSHGARDLIPRMLVVDPLKRITIPEIRHIPSCCMRALQLLKHRILVLLQATNDQKLPPYALKMAGTWKGNPCRDWFGS